MKFEPLKEKDSPPNHKVIVRKIEISYEELKKLSLSKFAEYKNEKMIKEKFNLNGKITKRECYKEKVIIYEQKKYIIPKRKKV